MDEKIEVMRTILRDCQNLTPEQYLVLCEAFEALVEKEKGTENETD